MGFAIAIMKQISLINGLKCDIITIDATALGWTGDGLILGRTEVKKSP